jgi:hypothetical protein
MSRMNNLVGLVKGRLTVQSYAGNNKRGRAKWLCRCSCGNTKIVLGDHLTRREKAVLSCGCLQQENRTKHGAYLPDADIKYHIKFSLWQSLKDRARRRGYESDLELDNMPNVPDLCPVFKTPFLLYRRKESGHGKGKGNNRHDNSPTIDRVDSNLPYTKKYASNLVVISWRANKLKSDATLVELEQVVDYMRHRVALKNERESSLIDSKPSTISVGNEAEAKSTVND